MASRPHCADQCGGHDVAIVRQRRAVVQRRQLASERQQHDDVVPRSGVAWRSARSRRRCGRQERSCGGGCRCALPLRWCRCEAAVQVRGPGTRWPRQYCGA
eukprot:4467502-Pyramimonas_sp.AAC.1